MIFFSFLIFVSRTANIVEGASLLFLLILSMSNLRNAVLGQLGKEDPIDGYNTMNTILLSCFNIVIFVVVTLAIAYLLFSPAKKKIFEFWEKRKWKKMKENGEEWNIDKLQ